MGYKGVRKTKSFKSPPSSKKCLRKLIWHQEMTIQIKQPVKPTLDINHIYTVSAAYSLVNSDNPDNTSVKNMPLMGTPPEFRWPNHFGACPSLDIDHNNREQ